MNYADMAFPDEICQQCVLIIKMPLHSPHFNQFENIAIAMFKNENFLFVYKNVYCIFRYN